MSRWIDADALPRHGQRGGLVHWKDIENAPSIDADRPQGYWTKYDVATYRCSECGKIQIADDVNELNYCCCCGSRNIDIVRCKECKWWIDNLTENDDDEAYDSCRWDWSRKIPTADDFCSYGEVRDE